jgi:AbrB family looped-hinge helix DNA binding protein
VRAVLVCQAEGYACGGKLGERGPRSETIPVSEFVWQQVTVPVEIRRELGIKEGDRVTFEMDEDEVRFKRSESVVVRTTGIFRGFGPAMSAEEMREAAELAFAEDVTEHPER